MLYPFAIGVGGVLVIYALMQVIGSPSIQIPSEISSPAKTPAGPTTQPVTFPPVQGLDIDQSKQRKDTPSKAVTTNWPQVASSQTTGSLPVASTKQSSNADANFLNEVAKHPSGRISVEKDKIKAEWGQNRQALQSEAYVPSSGVTSPVSLGVPGKSSNATYVDRRQVVINNTYVVRQSQKRIKKKRPPRKRLMYYTYYTTDPCSPYVR